MATPYFGNCGILTWTDPDTGIEYRLDTSKVYIEPIYKLVVKDFKDFEGTFHITDVVWGPPSNTEGEE